MSVDKESVNINSHDVLHVSTGGAATRRVAKVLVNTSPDDPAYSAQSIKVLESIGTGAVQNLAHGLGSTPSAVVVVPASFAGAVVVAEGTHTATNVVVSVTVGVEYKVIAFK